MLPWHVSDLWRAPSKIPGRYDPAQFARANRTTVHGGIVTGTNNPFSAPQRGMDVLKSPCWWVIFNTGCCCPPLNYALLSSSPKTFTPKQTQSLHLCSHKHLCCHVRGSSSNLQTGAIKKREVQEVMLPFPKYISFLHLYIKIQVPVYRIACSLQNIGSGYKQDYTYAGTKVTTAAACRTMICPLLKQVEAAQPTKQKTVWKEMGASWTEESNVVLSK